MAKVPGDTRIPLGTRVQAPGATRGAVRRTLQTGIAVGSRLLPSKLKIPGLKPRTKSPELPEANAVLKNDTMTIIPRKLEPFTMCNKQDMAEKTFHISPDNKERTFDIIPDFKEETFVVDEKAEKTFNIEEECENKKERLFMLGPDGTFKKETDFTKLGDHIGSKVDAVMPDLKSSVVRIITGILKYVGHVQMDDDIWCGVEADKVAKDLHDGSLNGVKYFSCEKGRGLLVPATQIKLQNQPACIVTDSKILELKNKLQTLRSKPNIPTNNLFRPNVVDITKRLIDEEAAEHQGESGPFSLLVGLDSTQIITEPKNFSDVTLDMPSSKNRFSTVGAASTPNDGKNKYINNNVSPQILNQDLLNINQTYSSDFNLPLLDAESMIEFQSINFDSPLVGHGSLVVSMPKVSEISSSQCETPPEVLSVDNSTAASSTPLESDNLSRNEAKSMPPPKSNKFVDKITSRDEIGTKKFILGPPTRKQNINELPYREKTPEVADKTFNRSPKKLAPGEIRRPKSGTATELPSPTVSDNSVQQMSKQNSFDESLGILTPDQMDSMSFLDNVRSPSVDDLNDLLDSSKTTEKTVSSNSQTPSTENVKSLTPDAIKLLLSTHEEDAIQEIDTNLHGNSTKILNCSSGNALENTMVCTDPQVCHLIDYEDDPAAGCDTYDHFVQRPFKQSTAENLSNAEICSTTITQTIDDELLPSVHSSILDPLSSVVDTTVNLDLPLDSRRYDNIHQNSANRMDQTPSPEELPLDPIDMRTDMLTLSANQFCNSIIQEQSLADSETKTDTTKSATSKVSNSFITSITSITSLDGYQGDGEMSRPVSRGADQSPTIGHRAAHNNLQNHWQNIPINRRPDPMTDSDFFTESDADGHDEQVHRGDRRAQVIDGALYGGGKASNPPVLVSRNGNSNNEDSCMESSGVFTDMETQRCSPLLLNAIDDLSPDGSSPSIRSELSQKNNSSGIFYDGFEGSLNGTVIAADLESSLRSPGDNDSNKELTVKSIKQAKINTSESKLAKTKSETSNISNATSDKMNKEEKNMALKKYKMPRRDVASKIKTMLSTTIKASPENDDKRASPKASRKGGRWDAVMNKISANKTEAKPKSHLKDVKSKVTSSRSTEKVRGSFEDTSNTSEATGPKTRTPPSKLKSRRVRSRLPGITMLAGSSRSSPHSSQSDVSISGPAPPQKNIAAKHNSNRAAKKRDVVAPGRNASPQSEAPTPNPPANVNSRLHTPPAVNGRPPNASVKKPGVVSALSGGGGGVATRGAPLPLRKPAPRRTTVTLSPKSQPHKDQNRASSPASKASGVVSGPVIVAPPALPILPAASLQLHQQHAQPTQQQLLRKPVSPPSAGVEALAVLVHYLVYQLDALNAPKWRAQAAGAKVQLSEAASRLQRALNAQRADQQALTECLSKITRLESELDSQKSKYNASILAVTTEQENKCRAALEDSAALSAEIRNLKVTLEELKKEVVESRTRFAQVERASQRRETERQSLIEELKQAKQLAEDLRRNQSPPCKQEDTLKAEVESLKAVLELKIIDLNSLRKHNEELEQAACRLPAALQRAATLADTAEDLRAQLDRKLGEEANLLQQNKQLQESFTQVAAQKNRLSLYNEELQYKLKHNTEVVNLIAAQSGNRLDPSAMASPRRAALSSSFSLGEGESDRVNHSLPPDTFVRGHSRMTASFNEKYLHSTNYKDRKGDWRSTPKRSVRLDSTDKPDFCDTNRSIESIQMSDCSPPNSPKIKGVVEKNDSVSWVVEIEEAPEETASRYVRRGGSFRTSTSPPGREALKRQRSRPKGSPPSAGHLLSQSASASCLEPIGQRGGCKLFRSGSVEHKQFVLRATSTPSKENGRRSCERGNLSRPRASSFSHEERNSSSGLSLEMESLESNLIYTKENNLLHKSMQIVDDYDTESLVSNGDLVLLQECEAVPKESAGEALISGTNSEDDVSLDDPSHSSSDCESVSECDGGGERPAERALAMIANNIKKDLSAAPMEYSWSEDGECPSFNADM